jgi:hypothetical protein
MPLNIPIAVRALRAARFPCHFPGLLFGAAVAQLHSAKRHFVDPIDQLANVFLIRIESKLVLQIAFVAQPRHQCARIIGDAHAVAGQKAQAGNHRRRLTEVKNHNASSSFLVMMRSYPVLRFSIAMNVRGFVSVFTLLLGLAGTSFAENWMQGTLVSVEVTTTQVTPKKIAHHYRCVVSDGSLMYSVEYDQPVKVAIHDPVKFEIKKDRLTLLDADGKKRPAQIETRERVTH